MSTLASCDHDDCGPTGCKRGHGTVEPLVRLFNAIKDAVNEMDRCPGDSIQDIWNEMLDKWETGLRMDHNHNIEPNTQAEGRQ